MAGKATERGSFEYLPMPFYRRELVSVGAGALSEPAGDEAKARPTGADGEEQLPLIGRSPAMQEIYRVLARLMPTDLTVMIYGESGTGKELVARALHDRSEEHTSELQSLMRNSYAVFCLKKQMKENDSNYMVNMKVYTTKTTDRTTCH